MGRQMQRGFPRITVALVAALLSAGKASADDQRFGVVAAAGVANDTCRQQAVDDLGIGWVRVAFKWSEMQPNMAPITAEKWNEVDLLVNGLTSRGLNIFWDVPFEVPAWANGGAGAFAPPTNQSDMYNFVYAVVRRYGFERNQIKYWGHWNEPNLPKYFSAPFDHFLNNELLTTVNAIKAADPNAKLVVGELSDSSSHDPVGHLHQILNKVGSQADVISLHVYRGCRDSLSFVDSLHSNIVSWGYGNLPVWVTETGANTADEAPKINFLECFFGGITARANWWKKVFWFRLEPSDEGNFSLLTGGSGACTMVPNATYNAYHDFIARLPCNNNFKCEYGEIPSTCPHDCPEPPCNNNGICEQDLEESHANCPGDCVCAVDGVCDETAGETISNCPADCQGDPCNHNHTCEPPHETLENCASDCTATGSCNNNCVCDPGENDVNCAHDCGVNAGWCCPNNACEPGEKFSVLGSPGLFTTCPQDCPGLPGASCATAETHDHHGSCGRVDSCGHAFGSNGDCGCAGAPVVWDTCTHNVCDACRSWHDDVCQDCATQWDTCWESQDEWCTETHQVCNSWDECWEEWEYDNVYYYCNTVWDCHDETETVFCGVHSYSHDCNPHEVCHPYLCNGHWEDCQCNCHDEEYGCNPHQCGW